MRKNRIVLFPTVLGLTVTEYALIGTMLPGWKPGREERESKGEEVRFSTFLSFLLISDFILSHFFFFSLPWFMGKEIIYSSIEKESRK